MKLFFSILVILSSVFSCLGWRISKNASGKTLVVGHRGANAVAPENTLPSFQTAIQLKADGIETDVRVTRDNVIILMHDSNVQRTTNGTGEVTDLTWNYIKNLDAGSWFDKSFAGAKVVLLDEFLAYLAGIVALRPDFFAVLDIKAHNVAAAIYILVKKYELFNNVYLSVWNEDDLLDFVNNGFKLNMWTGDQPSTWKKDGFFDGQKRSGIYGYSINQKTVSKEFVEASQAASMPVFLWTPTTTYEMRNAVSLAVSGVIVDDIEKMRNIIGS